METKAKKENLFARAALLFALLLCSTGLWAQGITLKATGGTQGANDKEGYEKLFDGIKENTEVEGEVVANKWCVDNIGGDDGPTYPIWVEFYSNVPIIPTQYVLTTGNDNSTEDGRNPRDWKLYGRDHQTLNVYLDDEENPLPDGKKETLEDGDDDTLF